MNKGLNETWKKDKKGNMILVSQEEVDIPDPKPTTDERLADLETKYDTLKVRVAKLEK